MVSGTKREAVQAIVSAVARLISSNGFEVCCGTAGVGSGTELNREWIQSTRGQASRACQVAPRPYLVLGVDGVLHLLVVAGCAYEEDKRVGSVTIKCAAHARHRSMNTGGRGGAAGRITLLSKRESPSVVLGATWHARSALVPETRRRRPRAPAPAPTSEFVHRYRLTQILPTRSRAHRRRPRRDRP